MVELTTSRNLMPANPISRRDVLKSLTIGALAGSVLRVRRDDRVHIHLVNDMEIAHGIDIQAAQLAPSKHFAPLPARRT